MPPKAPKVKVAGKLVDVFKKFDLNNDGMVTKQELAEVLRRLDPKMWTDKKLDRLFAQVDVDKDGKLDYDEFTRWLMKTPEKDADRKAVVSASEKLEKASDAKGDKAAEPKAAGPSEPTVDDALLEKIFAWFDEDQDGQLERIEVLDGEERRQGRLNFTQANRKQVVAWFKDAGAEGTVTAGMFLSKEKWKAAMIKLAASSAEEPAKAEAWLKEQYAVCLEVKPKADTGAKQAGDDEAPKGTAPPRELPTYPITIAFKDLKRSIEEAGSFGKTVLVLSSGLNEVETFLAYQMMSTVDCKQLIAEMFVSKSHTKEQEQDVVRTKIEQAMNASGFCKPLHVRMANSAFDWKGFCCDKVPAELFDKRPAATRAFELGFFDAAHNFTLTIDDRWKDFYVLITSTFDADSAKEFLAKALPFYEGMATIIVDPASIDK